MLRCTAGSLKLLRPAVICQSTSLRDRPRRTSQQVSQQSAPLRSEGFGGPVEHGQGEQQCALQAEVAIFRRIPLAQSMCAAAVPTGSYGQGGNVQGDRYVGVRGSEAGRGLQVE